MTAREEPLFDAVVRIDRLPAGGRSIDVELDATQREQLAATLKLISVEHFTASLTVAPLRGGLRAQGRLNATIVQPSVVSFEPITQVIEEEVDRVFLPAERCPKPTPGAEIFVDLEDDNFPDHIDGPEVDLSALLIETLALAIEPYPRLEGESIDDLGLGDQAAESGPFAALSKLKEP